MASINTIARELVLKIVYYGPGLGGKTTSLQSLHDTSPPERRGKLVSLATPVDRTLYFDFLPLRLPPLRGLSVRLQLFTVPGQVYFNATRRLVLSGADGIVFVADSQLERMDANLESLENLRDNLAEHARDLTTIPHVFSWNKRDLEELVSIEELDRTLNPHGAPSYGTIAPRGTNVDQVLAKITSMVVAQQEAQMPAQRGSIAPGLVARDSPSVSVHRVERVEEETVESSIDKHALPAPLSPGEGDAVETSSSALAPSEGTFLANLERIEAAASKPIVDEELESVVEKPSDEKQENAPEKVPESAAETRRASAADLANLAMRPPRVDEGPPSAQRASTAPAPPLPPEPNGHAHGEERNGLSFTSLFPPTERPVIEQIESYIAHGDHADALGMCEAALARLFAPIANLAGLDDREGGGPTLPLLVGLDGRRYLAFRAMARRARRTGDVGLRDALEGYAFVLEAKVATSQWEALRGALAASSAAPPPRTTMLDDSILPPLPRGSISPPSSGDDA